MSDSTLPPPYWEGWMACLGPDPASSSLPTKPRSQEAAKGAHQIGLS